MLLYIHFPFCKSKCIYCNFYSVKINDELVKLYLNGLFEEIKYWKDKLPNIKFKSIYIGGGTPSILKLKYLDQIINALFKNFKFENYIEFSFEGNPDSLKDLIYLKELKSFGVNRISIGIQSIRDSYLKFLGRTHSAKDAIFSVKLCNLAKFENINIDLIWGLPEQTVASWLHDLRQICKLDIQHISCYGLTVEQGTRLHTMVKKNIVTLPNENRLASLYIGGADFLESRGFIQYEISNFSKLGYVCMHNMGYWEQMDYLGLGPSAVSTIGNKRWENCKNIVEYSQNPCRRKEIKLNKKDQINEFIMLSLRTTRGLNLKEYAKKTGENFWKKHHKIINLLHKNNLVKIRNGYLSLTKNGFLVSNSIIEKFFI